MKAEGIQIQQLQQIICEYNQNILIFAQDGKKNGQFITHEKNIYSRTEQKLRRAQIKQSEIILALQFMQRIIQEQHIENQIDLHIFLYSLIKKSYEKQLQISIFLQFLSKKLTNSQRYINKRVEIDYICKKILPLINKSCSKQNYKIMLQFYIDNNECLNIAQKELKFIFIIGINMFKRFSQQQILEITYILISAWPKIKNETFFQFKLSQSSSFQLITIFILCFSKCYDVSKSIINQFFLEKNIVQNLINSEVQFVSVELLFNSLIDIFIMSDQNTKLNSEVLRLIQEIIKYDFNTNLTQCLLKKIYIDKSKKQKDLKAIQKVLEIISQCQKIYNFDKKILAFNSDNSYLKIPIQDYPRTFYCEFKPLKKIKKGVVIEFYGEKENKIQIFCQKNKRQLIFRIENKSKILPQFTFSKNIKGDYQITIGVKKNVIEIICNNQKIQVQLNCVYLIFGSFLKSQDSKAIKHFSILKEYKQDLGKIKKQNLVKDYIKMGNILDKKQFSFFSFMHQKLQMMNIQQKILPSFITLFQKIGGTDIIFIIFMHLIALLEEEAQLVQCIDKFKPIIKKMGHFKTIENLLLQNQNELFQSQKIQSKLSNQNFLKKLLCICYRLLNLKNQNNQKKYSYNLVIFLYEYLTNQSWNLFYRLDFLSNFNLWKTESFEFQEIIYSIFDQEVRNSRQNLTKNIGKLQEYCKKNKLSTELEDQINNIKVYMNQKYLCQRLFFHIQIIFYQYFDDYSGIQNFIRSKAMLLQKIQHEKRFFKEVCKTSIFIFDFAFQIKQVNLILTFLKFILELINKNIDTISKNVSAKISKKTSLLKKNRLLQNYNEQFLIEINQARFYMFLDLFKAMVQKIYFRHLFDDVTKKEQRLKLQNQISKISEVIINTIISYGKNNIESQLRSNITFNSALNSTSQGSFSHSKSEGDDTKNLRFKQLFVSLILFGVSFSQNMLGYFIHHKQLSEISEFVEACWQVILQNNFYVLFDHSIEAQNLIYMANIFKKKMTNKNLSLWLERYLKNIKLKYLPQKIINDFNSYNESEFINLIRQITRKCKKGQINNQPNEKKHLIFDLKLIFIIINYKKPKFFEMITNPQNQFINKNQFQKWYIFLDKIKGQHSIMQCEDDRQINNSLKSSMTSISRKSAGLLNQTQKYRFKTIECSKSQYEKIMQLICSQLKSEQINEEQKQLKSQLNDRITTQYSIQSKSSFSSEIVQILFKILQFKFNYYLEMERVKIDRSKIFDEKLVFTLALTRKNRFKYQSIQYFKILQTRKKFIAKLNSISNEIQQNNSLFWQYYLREKQEYILSEFTNYRKQRSFIIKKKKKEQIQLPKLYQTNALEQLAINYNSYQIQEEELLEQDLHLNDKKKAAEKMVVFNVLYITNRKIYQGKLTVLQKFNIQFVQNEVIDIGLYKSICALQTEKRTILNIFENKIEFEFQLNSKTKIMLKKYLQVSNSLQISTQNQNYFFRFENENKRRQFLNLDKHYIKWIQNKQNVASIQDDSIFHQYVIKWTEGRISNFQYLMIINDFAGRSINDISQYYIFPWTVTNFQAKSIDKQFLSNPKNFRALNKPIGQLNKKRFQSYKRRYQQALKNELLCNEAYTYGIYHSNPAVVCNFLIRIDPFSTHHFLLMDKRYDEADRLFFSIESNWQGTYTNYSDIRQIIPEFYYFPEFLRNRSKYKFGHRRCKQQVDNVILPNWVKTRTPEQFIFKMRKCLQSKIVTENLNKWIELTFGRLTDYQEARKEAQKGQIYNVFTKNVYKSKKQQKHKNTIKMSEDKQFQLLYFKQFGQMPTNLDLYDPGFCKIRNQIIDFPKQMLNKSTEKYKYQSQYTEQQSKQINLAKMQSPICLNEKNSKRQLKLKELAHKLSLILIFDAFKIIVSNKIQIKTQIIIYSYSLDIQSEVIHNSKQFQSLMQFDFIELISTNKCSQNIFITIQDGKLYFNKINKSFLASRYQFKNVNTNKNVNINNFSHPILKVMNESIIIADKQEILILTNIQKKQNIGEILQLQDYRFKKQIFSQHTSNIIKMAVCSNKSIIVSIDDSLCVYIVQKSMKLQVLNFFNIEEIFTAEGIIDLQIHELGLIILLCQTSRILVYNFFGQTLINCFIRFVSHNQIRLENKQELVTSICIFNQQDSQLLIGTNLGHLWKVDLFDDLTQGFIETNTNKEARSGHQSEEYLITCKEKPFHLLLDPKQIKESQEILRLQEDQLIYYKDNAILEIKVSRIGRHYQLFAIFQNSYVLHLKSVKFEKSKLMSIIYREEDD